MPRLERIQGLRQGPERYTRQPKSSPAVASESGCHHSTTERCSIHGTLTVTIEEGQLWLLHEVFPLDKNLPETSPDQRWVGRSRRMDD